MKDKVSILKNKVLIIGCGRLGGELACRLQKKGRNVTIIDKDKGAYDFLDGFQGFERVGDAADYLTLEKYGVKTADLVIVATNDDATNIFIAEVCSKIYEVPNVYVRVSDVNRLELIKDTNIKEICPFQLSVDEFFNIYKE